MSAIDTISRICETSIVGLDCRYCLVKANKLPYKITGELARPNQPADFVSLAELVECSSLSEYEGVGLSIQASNICSIDVDDCFTEARNIETADDRAKSILEMFKDTAYAEFSFSGKGLRLFFNANAVNDYSISYYIKNQKFNIEYYQPSNTARYVTITGYTIYDNFNNVDDELLIAFLQKYMKKDIKKIIEIEVNEEDDRPIEELIIMAKRLSIKNVRFQDLWFKKAPGSGKDESETDYEIIAFIFEHITQNREKLRLIFEESNYYKSKDDYHKRKWSNNEYRYYNFQYDNVRRRH